MSTRNHDYKFVSPPDDNLKCFICLEVAQDPKQHEDCGKLFCSECIEKNGRKACPNCRAVNQAYFKDRRGWSNIARTSRMLRGLQLVFSTAQSVDILITLCGHSRSI